MVAAAVAVGHSATDRLLTDWQSAGLLDRPTKRGLGRGKGITALWPESQLRLWLLLLDKRRQTSQIPNLCNVPVALWLFFGDTYATLDQVKKSMRTWAQRYGPSRGHKQAKQIARRLVTDLPLQISNRNARAALIEHVAAAVLHGIRTDSERRDLRRRLLLAIGVKDGQELPPAGPVLLVELVLIRLLAARQLTNGTVPDHVVLWARAWHLFKLQEYLAAHEAGNLPSVPGIPFDRPSLDTLIPNACRDLLTAIGMAMSLSKDEPMPAPFLNLDAWANGQVALTVSHEVEQSRIVLPGGRVHANVKIEVSGSVITDPTTSRQSV
jgi:hypothetical protein